MCSKVYTLTPILFDFLPRVSIPSAITSCLTEFFTAKALSLCMSLCTGLKSNLAFSKSLGIEKLFFGIYSLVYLWQSGKILWQFCSVSVCSSQSRTVFSPFNILSKGKYRNSAFWPINIGEVRNIRDTNGTRQNLFTVQQDIAWCIK